MGQFAPALGRARQRAALRPRPQRLHRQLRSLRKVSVRRALLHGFLGPQVACSAVGRPAGQARCRTGASGRSLARGLALGRRRPQHRTHLAGSRHHVVAQWLVLPLPPPLGAALNGGRASAVAALQGKWCSDRCLYL